MFRHLCLLRFLTLSLSLKLCMVMDNQNQSKLKLKICRIFRSSFGYCKSKSISDVVQKSSPPPPPTPVHPRRHRLSEPISLKPELSSHTLQKKWSQVVETVDQNCSSSKDRIFYRKRVKNRRRPSRPRKKETFDAYYEFFSSEEDEEEEDDRTTLFSSRSRSSDSSDSFLRNKGGIGSHRRRRRTAFQGNTMKVKESMAVAKRSRDPYSDFRNSMVEMIVEKQIFEAKELENLLQAFLGLNSSRHHPVILEAYTEILEALFSVGR